MPNLFVKGPGYILRSRQIVATSLQTLSLQGKLRTMESKSTTSNFSDGVIGNVLRIDVQITNRAPEKDCEQPITDLQVKEEIGQLGVGEYMAQLFVNCIKKYSIILFVTQNVDAVMPTGRFINQ